MSALGQKQTFGPFITMSALPQKRTLLNATGMSALCQKRTSPSSVLSTKSPGVRAKAPRPQAARPMGSILRLQPGYDFRPYMSLCVASDQNPEMLQADTEFTGIFNNLHVFCHCIREWLQ